MFEVSQVSVFIRSRVILGDGRVRLAKDRERWIESDRRIELPSLPIFPLWLNSQN